jgi:hypothetical protein
MVNAAGRADLIAAIRVRVDLARDGDLANLQRFHERRYESETAPYTVSERLPIGVTLPLILLLSLGLWGMVWLAVSSLLS